MSKQIPAYTVEGDEVVFADGVRYRMQPKAPGEARATPEEMYRAITGLGGEPVSAADMAVARGRKVDMGTYDMRSK